MSTKNLVSNLATGLMVLCALAVTGMAVRNNFFPPNSGQAREQGPRTIRDWRQYAQNGAVLGSADAPVTIVEFSDFQCPFCAGLSKTIRDMQARQPNRFRVVYRHFPLAQHTHAVAAGTAAECAGEQGRFAEYHDLLFSHQDSIGERPWARFATAAGVADTIAFNRCIAGPAARARVEADAKTAAKLELPGTPSLIVNGRLYSGAISEAELDSMIAGAR